MKSLVGTQTLDLCTGSRCYYLPSLLLLLAALNAACSFSFPSLCGREERSAAQRPAVPGDTNALLLHLPCKSVLVLEQLLSSEHLLAAPVRARGKGFPVLF